MLSTLARRLDLQADELRLAVTLGAILFAITSSYTLVKTARDVLFLAQLPATTLPYVYLGVGVVTVIVSVLVSRLTHRLRTAETLAGAALVSALILAAFVGLTRDDQEWIAVLFYVWVNVYGLILVSQFWAFTNSVSHPGEAKRIFGIIGGGGILGGLVGGIVAGRVGSGVGVPWLLIMAAALVALTVPGVYVGLRRGTVPEPEAIPEEHDGETRPWKVRYVRWLALAALCSVLVTGLLDYQFKVEIQTRYPSRAELASFFGLFYTVMNLAALTFQVFGTRVLLQRLGAGWSAAVLPMGLGIGATVTMIVPGFASVIGTRLWDQVTRLSLNKSATELFYFPLDPALRRRSKALIEAGLERTGDALAGLLILALTVSLGASTWTLAFLVVVLVALWITAWFGVRRGYVKELGRNLRRMNLDPTQARISLREASLRGEILRLLQSPYERVVLHGIAMLEENDPRALRGQLGRLVNHGSPAVRARALALAAVMDPESTRTRIRELIEDADPFVRLEALRAQAALGEGHPVEALEELVNADDPKLRSAALQSLFELAPATEEDRLRALAERLAAGDAGDRARLAEALGARAGPSRLHELLTPLLDDEDVEVRREALKSAGRAGRREHVPRLLEALSDREVHHAARTAVAQLGERVVGTLGDYLVDPTVPLPLRRAIPRVLGDIGTAEAAAALYRARGRDDVLLAYRILKAANRIRIAHPKIEFPSALVSEDLEFDVRSHLFALVHYRTCPIGGSASGERLLCIALNERMDQALNRVFRHLALLYPPGDILAAFHGVTNADPRVRGNALEYLENALAPEHRALVMPLVDDTGDEGRLAFAESRFGLRYLGYEESLQAILAGEDSWLRAIALYVVAKRGERSYLGQVRDALSAADPRVRDTARWAQTVLAPA